MTELYEAPFNLVQGDLVQVKSQAVIKNDWCELSEPNISGVYVQVTPYMMLKP